MANVKSIITNSQGNVLINTETDTGHNLSVNGTALFSNKVSLIRSGSNDQLLIKTSSNNGSRIGHDSLGLYFSNDDTSLDVLRIYGGASGALRFSIDSSGVLYLNSGYLAYGDGTFTSLYAPDTNGGITMGDATGPVNVYYNDAHVFQSAGQLVDYGGFTSTGFGVGTVAPSSKLEVVKQGNASGGTMLLSGSKTNNQGKYGIIATTQYASDTETEGVGLIGGVNTSTENIVVVGGGIDELNTATSIRFFAAANTTTRGSANERMRVNNAANDSGNLYIGTTSTNDYGRLILNGFSGLWLPYIAGTSLSYNQYGIVVGNSNTANANIGGGLTLVNNTASVGAYSPVISWSSMSAGGTYNSTYAFITGIYGGQGGDANWAIGDMIFGTAETYGASERMRIRYNGNVLINTTTDSGYKLRVNGTSMIDSSLRLGGNMTVGGDTSQWSLTGVANGGAIWQKSHSGAGGSDDRYLRLGNVDNNGTPNYVLTIFNSNVGIGTTDPGAKLEVIDEVRVTSSGAYASVTTRNTGATGGGGFLGYQNGVASAFFGVAGWYLGNTDAGIIIGTDSSSRPIRFYTNFEQMRITGGGNVLINTTTDAGYKLDVNGTGRIQGNLYTAARQYVQVSGNTLLSYKIPYNGLSNVAGTTVSDSQASDGTAMVRYSAAGNDTFFYGPYTTLEPGNYVAKFRIKVASNASASYIGYIDVSGTNVNGQDISLRPNMFPTGGDYYYIDVPFTCNGSASNIEFRWIDWRTGITDTYLDHILVTSQAQANNVYVQDGGSYTVYEAQLPRLRISNGSGNVGIGTTAPAEKLEVVGNIQTTVSGGDAIVWAKNGTVQSYLVANTTGGSYGLVGTSTNHDFLLRTNNTEKMRVTSAGNVYINSTSMDGKFGINTASSTAYNPNAYNGNSANIRLTNGSAGVDRYTGIAFGGGGATEAFIGSVQNASELAEVVFQTFNGSTYGERMRITSAGNVGIGTTNPGAKLEVNGSAIIDTWEIDSFAVNNAWLAENVYFDGSNFRYRANGYAMLLYSDAGSGFQLRMSNGTGVAGNVISTATNLSIKPNGNVQIGTTTDNGAKLRVYGGYMTVEGTNTAMYIESNYGGGNGLDAGTLISAGGINSNIVIIPSGGGVAGSKVVGSAYNGSAWRSMLEYANVSSGEPVLSLVKTAGNVGIGNTTPRARLVVGTQSSGTFGSGVAQDNSIIGIFGAANSADRVTALTLSNTAAAQIGNDATLSFIVAGNYSATGLISTILQNTSSAATDMVFSLYDSSMGEKMRMKANGNLLIGTTTDGGYKLRVNGEILADDDIRILNTYALVLNGTDNNWRIGRNTITDSGWLTGNTLQVVVFGGSSGQGFQVVNTNGTALFEIDGVQGYTRITTSLGVGVDPSGTTGRIDASNDIVAYSTSDQRLKENITPIANALDKVKALTGVEFDWKEETKDVHGYEGHDVGVIAQEVQAVLPEAVRTNDSGYLSVRYEKMIALLVEANKELASRVEELEKKLK